MKINKIYFKYFVLVLVLGLVIFAGCSKESDLQTTPKDTKMIKNISNNLLNVPYTIKFKYSEIPELFNYQLLSEKTYLLSLIIMAYQNNEIQFYNKNKGKTFINNLESIIISYSLSKEKNGNGILNKLNELFIKIPQTSDLNISIIESIFLITETCIRRNLELGLSADIQFVTWGDVQAYFTADNVQITPIIIYLVVAGGVLLLSSCDGNTIRENAYQKCLDAAQKDFLNCRNKAYAAYLSTQQTSEDYENYQNQLAECKRQLEQDREACYIRYGE